MTITVDRPSNRNWAHKLQRSTLTVEPIAARVQKTQVEPELVTSGEVFDVIQQLRRVLKEPEKHPRVKIIYAKDS